MTDADHPIPPVPPVPGQRVPPMPPLPGQQVPQRPSSQPWTAPAVPPFGAPTGYAYAPPPGYAAAPYPAPAGMTAAVAPALQRSTSHSSGLGLTALIVAIAAAVLPTIAVSIAAFQIGLGAGRRLADLPAQFDWSILTPVRDWVLLAEISFWAGTALGVWAIVQGIIAIVTRRGRGLGIAAVAVAVAGAIVYAIALQGFLTAGLAAGTGIGG